MQSRRSSSNKLCLCSIFRWGPCPKTEGLVVKNELLDTLIGIAASLLRLVTITLYFYAPIGLMASSYGLLKTMGITACITPCFILLWRAIEFFEIAYNEDYAMGPPNNDQAAGNIYVVRNTNQSVWQDF
ncbi:hypothetical protein EJB05_17979 [Eragrostis curvula]|uniref:Uncharacterized protein n=1 Tax=Eragrostis curvula TaxID=38414 RepID=A0A5J9VKT8_9POAL|nr:hypothetical protein EJB05_17979 [Eragrostis curvula]